jgi:hypothetical protein
MPYQLVGVCHWVVVAWGRGGDELGACVAEEGVEGLHVPPGHARDVVHVALTKLNVCVCVCVIFEVSNQEVLVCVCVCVFVHACV